MSKEERVAILAAFAVGAGAAHDAAWTLAAEASAEHPDDLIAASRAVVQEAKLGAWGLG